MKSLISTIIFVLIGIKSFAAVTQGCQATLGSNNIYYVTDGMNGSVPQFKNDNFANVVFFANAVCNSGLGNGQGSCFIKGYNGPGDAYGTLITYSTSATDCPLDDFLIYLAPIIGALGAFKLKKKDCSLLNE